MTDADPNAIPPEAQREIDGELNERMIYPDVAVSVFVEPTGAGISALIHVEDDQDASRQLTIMCDRRITSKDVCLAITEALSSLGEVLG